MKPLLLAALLALPVVGSAQVTQSIALGVGFRRFGDRLERPGDSFGYSNSLAFELRGERKLGRRSGLILAVYAAPFSAQRATLGDVGIFDDVSTFGGELALSFRFKPTAPIFFYAGGEFQHVSKYSDPREAGGAFNEPGGTLGVGYDVHSSGKYNARVQIGLHLMKTADGTEWIGDEGVIPSPNTAKSLSRDWTFMLALRRALKKA